MSLCTCTLSAARTTMPGARPLCRQWGICRRKHRIRSACRRIPLLLFPCGIPWRTVRDSACPSHGSLRCNRCCGCCRVRGTSRSRGVACVCLCHRPRGYSLYALGLRARYHRLRCSAVRAPGRTVLCHQVPLSAAVSALQWVCFSLCRRVKGLSPSRRKRSPRGSRCLCPRWGR